MCGVCGVCVLYTGMTHGEVIVDVEFGVDDMRVEQNAGVALHRD